MNISSRCDYACRAVVELARYADTTEPLTATVIAERRAIPEKYLVHILLQLKRAGIVRSVRGAQGGYILAVPPDTLTLLDVVRAIDGPPLEPTPGAGTPNDELAATWQGVAKDIEAILDGVTVQAILDQAAKPGMYFI